MTEQASEAHAAHIILVVLLAAHEDTVSTPLDAAAPS